MQVQSEIHAIKQEDKLNSHLDEKKAQYSNICITNFAMNIGLRMSKYTMAIFEMFSFFYCVIQCNVILKKHLISNNAPPPP